MRMFNAGSLRRVLLNLGLKRRIFGLRENFGQLSLGNVGTGIAMQGQQWFDLLGWLRRRWILLRWNLDRNLFRAWKWLFLAVGFPRFARGWDDFRIELWFLMTQRQSARWIALNPTNDGRLRPARNVYLRSYLFGILISRYSCLASLSFQQVALSRKAAEFAGLYRDLPPLIITNLLQTQRRVD